ncbi:hypothetical protein BKA61DRAFT_690917 [Leptodontidium sp. MPI-SDFR-AT-0119]|nr:hypothetical protein BKA61DRAFT_690917 [Leptodontidium sp. MPI-SDFR-AT-0119]
MLQRSYRLCHYCGDAGQLHSGNHPLRPRPREGSVAYGSKIWVKWDASVSGGTPRLSGLYRDKPVLLSIRGAAIHTDSYSFIAAKVSVFGKGHIYQERRLGSARVVRASGIEGLSVVLDAVKQDGRRPSESSDKSAVWIRKFGLRTVGINSIFIHNALEVQPLATIFGIDFVGICHSGNIVLLNNVNTIGDNKCFCHHQEPFLY